MNRTEFAKQIAAAKRELYAAGWVQSHSIMSDQGDKGNCYGIVFIRHGFRFYLNKDTLGMVAEACQPTPEMTNVN